MLSEIIDPRAESPRSKLFWAVIAALALALLGVFYSVCIDQVRRSDAREAGYRAQRLALTDCIQYRPNTTIGSCARQAAAQLGRGQDDGLADSGRQADAAMTSAVPVNFAFR
ncbi:MAG: hypothetical protein ABIT82_06495 [Ramlibacter sp.]